MSILSCSAPDCHAPVFVKKSQLCQPHYNRFQRYGDLEIEIPLAACLRCSDPIPPKVRTSGPSPKYCGYDCKRLAAYERSISSGAYAQQQRIRRANFQPKPLTVRPCAFCGNGFESKRDDAQFCSKSCGTKWKDANAPTRCGEPHCERGVRAKGLCSMHWRRKARAEGREAPDAWSERRKANYHKRRAQKLGTQVEDLRPVDIYERDIWLCGLCLTPVDPDCAWPDPMSPSLDHIRPLSLGGPHTYENVQLAHLVCNVSKGNRVAA